LVKANKGNIAAIIIEPVAGNMGLVTPIKGFLEDLRQICDQEKIVLIFDEVMTGFRLASGGAQQLLGVTPDMTTLGKIIGGGMPVGAYGGKKEIMDCIAPVGGVYQAGTLSGNPVAMSAGLAMLTYLKNNPDLYNRLDHKTSAIVAGFNNAFQEAGFNFTINHIGSMFTVFFTDKKVIDFDTAKTSDTAMFGKYFQAMLSQGIYMAPSQYESLFISDAISETEIAAIVKAHKNALKVVLSF
jgi:glutamate-1-semialdehyde 2,1-aminomutase